jgi:hypothetical protein
MKPQTYPYGYCPYCEDWHIGEWQDEGIGAYEYWGAPGFHHDWRAVCSVCGAELTEYQALEREDYA